MKAQSGGRSCPKESQQIRHARHTTYFAGATSGTIGHAEVRTSLRAGHAPGNSMALANGRVLGVLTSLTAGCSPVPTADNQIPGRPGLLHRRRLGCGFETVPTGSRENSVEPQVRRVTMPFLLLACSTEASSATGAALSGPPFPFGLRRPPLVGRCATQAKHSGPRLDRRPAIQP